MPPPPPRVLVVDPIFRGSRLFYSWIAAQGAVERGMAVDVVTRTGAETEHSREMMGDLPFTLHEAVRLPADFWYGRLGAEAVAQAVDAAIDLARRQHYALVYVAGLNELMPDLVEALHRRDLSALRDTPVVAIDYDARLLMRRPPGGTPRHPWRFLRREVHFLLRTHGARRQYRALKRRLPGLRIGLLDERAFDPAWGRPLARQDDLFFSLPDPPPPLLIERDEPPPPASAPLRLLLVGLQSRRKGMVDVLRAARDHLADRDDIQFILSGRLADETRNLAPQLARLGGRFLWHEGFVPEVEIQARYRAADYVLLPYAGDFHGSSGVMANALAFGKPLVATDHGCIGYRVARFGLGRSYRAGDAAGLAAVLRALPGRDHPDYHALRRRCLDHTQGRSVAAQQALLFQFAAKA